MKIMILGYTFVFLFAVSLVASDGLPEIDSGLACLWKRNGCRMDEPSPSFVRSNSLPVPEQRIIYSEDGDTKVFKWIRKQDGGEISGYIFHIGDQWFSYCFIDKEADSEIGLQIQNEIAADCKKEIGIYKTKGKNNILHIIQNSNGIGVVGSYQRSNNLVFYPNGRYG